MATVNQISEDAVLIDRCTGEVVHIPTVPIGKPRMTQRDKWQQRPAIVAYRAYCDELRLRLPRYQLERSLSITFYLPMPPSWSLKKRQAMNGQPHDQKPDIDNLVKGFMDAFKAEDKHVAILHAEKYWAVKGGITIYL